MLAVQALRLSLWYVCLRVNLCVKQAQHATGVSASNYRMLFNFKFLSIGRQICSTPWLRNDPNPYDCQWQPLWPATRRHWHCISIGDDSAQWNLKHLCIHCTVTESWWFKSQIEISEANFCRELNPVSVTCAGYDYVCVLQSLTRLFVAYTYTKAWKGNWAKFNFRQHWKWLPAGKFWTIFKTDIRLCLFARWPWHAGSAKIWPHIQVWGAPPLPLHRATLTGTLLQSPCANTHQRYCLFKFDR